MQSNTVSADKINTLLDYVAEAMKDGGEFVQREAPAVAAEILQYHTVQSWIVLVTGFIVGVTCVLSMLYVHHKRIKHEMILACVYGIGWTFSLFSLFAVSDSAMNLVKCYTAPRVVILEYVRGK